MLSGEGMAPFVDRRRHAELRPLPGLATGLVRRKDDSDDDDDDNSGSRKGKGRFNNKSRGDGDGSGDGNGGGKGRGGGNGGGGGGKSGGGGGDGKGRGKNNNKSNDDDSGNGRSKNNDDNNNDNEDDNKTKSGSTSTAAPPPAVVVNPQVSTPPPAAIPPDTTSVPPPADPKTVTVEPATVTMSPTTVVLMSTVFPDASTPIAQNPAVTSFLSVQTTGLPTDPVNSQPRKGVDEPEELSPTPAFSITESSTTIFPTALANTTPTALAENNGDGNKHGDGSERHKDGNGNGNNNKNNGDKNGGMSQTAEHLLISAGSIGAFILVCFVAWIVWRTMKKSKKRNAAAGGSRYTRADRFLNKVPWIARRRQTQWDGLGDNGSMDLRGAPPSYKEQMQSATLQDQEYYASAPEKPLPQKQPQTEFLPEIALGQTNLNRSLTANTGYSHQAGESFSSVNAAQFMGTMQTDPNLTIRSRMPDAFYNQSELARQPSDAYDPTRRQVNRASELSSLSSGFGDGDIIIPETYIRPPQPASQALRQSNNYVGRFSWMSRKSGTNRDTVYTQNSEDSPPRFRSVNSWVNQQTGRVRRAEQRANEEIPPVPDMPVPGVHNPPPEPEMTMMMDDGQAPRRPGT